jgi:hypothetical protein
MWRIDGVSRQARKPRAGVPAKHCTLPFNVKAGGLIAGKVAMRKKYAPLVPMTYAVRPTAPVRGWASQVWATYHSVQAALPRGDIFRDV